MPLRHPPPHPNSLRGRRVLVVEDEALVAMLIEAGLRDAGAYIVGPASTVDEALTLIEMSAHSGGLDAAVLDINLGGSTITPVADRLVAFDVPFVFGTGYDQAWAHEIDTAAPVLTKPFSTDALVDAIRGLRPSSLGRAARPAGHSRNAVPREGSEH
jgi:CheY-like chemotaxis protein